ncbi:hypothetical protein BURMUCF2_B0112 [Burkholderia multivorans CF2]|nr:hypothetical protein BURMUCF2_B0112 [Burkholderia multivorans CF2]
MRWRKATRKTRASSARVHCTLQECASRAAKCNGVHDRASSSRRTPHTAHRTPHTAHRTPHTAHRTPHTAHRTPHLPLLPCRSAPRIAHARDAGARLARPRGGDDAVAAFDKEGPT